MVSARHVMRAEPGVLFDQGGLVARDTIQQESKWPAVWIALIMLLSAMLCLYAQKDKRLGAGVQGLSIQRSENIWNENNEDIPGTSDPVTFTSPPLPADYGPLDGIKEAMIIEIVNRTDSTVVLEQFDVHMYPEFAQCTQVWLASHDGLSSSVISAATSNVRVPLVVRLEPHAHVRVRLYASNPHARRGRYDNLFTLASVVACVAGKNPVVLNPGLNGPSWLVTN